MIDRRMDITRVKYTLPSLQSTNLPQEGHRQDSHPGTKNAFSIVNNLKNHELMCYAIYLIVTTIN